MTKKTKTWLIVGGILLAIVIISAVSGGDKKDGSQADTAAAAENTQAAVVEEEEDDTLPIQTLITAYDENEVAAKNEYQGKRFKFKGTISDIGVNPIGDQPYIHLDRKILVHFYFSSSSVVAKLKKGDKIKLEGTIDSNLGSIISVKKCKLVE